MYRAHCNPLSFIPLSGLRKGTNVEPVGRNCACPPYGLPGCFGYPEAGAALWGGYGCIVPTDIRYLSCRCQGAG
jgi:hypothetical protein